MRLTFPLAPLAAIALVPPVLEAQARTAAPPVGYVMQVEVSQRWMNARQQPRFTLHTRFADDLRIDSVRAGPWTGGRTLFLDASSEEATGAYEHDALGRPRRVTGRLVEHPRGGFTVADSIWLTRGRLFADFEERALTLPAARLWDLVPTFPAGPPRRGLTWSDSLDLHAAQDGLRQDLAGRRFSRVVNDTVVGGRRLWIVRDSAVVGYAERAMGRERTLDTLWTVDHETRGVIHGRHLYDPVLHLFRSRHDTTALAGMAVLRYPDGRAFPSRTRFDRVRVWTLLDSAGLARRAREREAEEERSGSSVVHVIEPNGIEDRVISGDRGLRDSLVAAWRRSSDPDERAEILAPLWEHGGDSLDVAELAFEAGDTAFAAGEVPNRFYSTIAQVSERALRWGLALMNDPGLAFDFGVDRDPPYENAVQGLVEHPPAVTPDSTSWPCTRAACQILARQWTAAREQRLRDVGLVAALALEPRRWADTVLAEAAKRPRLLADAARLVRGAQPVGPSGEGPRLPPAGADWRAWRAWAAGREDQERFFEKPIFTTVRFHEALTGRDIVGELRRARDTAKVDSARLVLGTLLMSFAEPVRGVDEVHAALAHGSPAERSLAVRESERLLDSAPPADTATVTELLGRMLATMIDGAPAWRWLDTTGTNGRPPVRPVGVALLAEVGDSPHRLYIAGDPLSPALRAAWAVRARVTGPGQPGPGNREAAILYTSFPVVRVGPFARLNVRWSTTEARTADQEPFAAAGGANVDLVLIDGEWWVIDAGEWIT